MTLLTLPILDYTDKDFESLRLRLQGLARSVFPEWTDFNTPNFGNMLLEMFAFVGDMNSFYSDAQAREHFWPTVTRRLSAIRMGRLINFNLPGATAATGTARFSIPAVLANNVIIEPGTRIRSLDPLDPIPYRTSNTTRMFILAGQTFVDVPIEQVEYIENETFESSGAPNQEFILSRVPYLDASAVVVASDGTYVRTPSFLDTSVTAPRRFVELVDQNDRAHIRFGNNVLGSIPAGTISISYKITRGAQGRIEAGTLGVVLDTIYDTTGAAVAGVQVSNPTATSGGADRMSVAQARSLAPASLRSLTRTISRPDFETHALEVTGVARAAMLTSNEDGSVLENTGKLMIVARGAQLPSGSYVAAAATEALRAAVLNKVTVEKPGPITFQTEVLNAPFKQIDVYTQVHFMPNVVPLTVAEDVATNLREFFAAVLSDGTANTNVDFGANILDENGDPVGEIAWSDIFNAVRDTAGVRKMGESEDNLLLNADPTRDPSLGGQQSIAIGLRDFPTLNRIVVVDAVSQAVVLSTTGDDF